MSKTVNLHSMNDLDDGKNEILLETHLSTELHIIKKEGHTVIRLTNNNFVDIVNGVIIIRDRT